VHILIVRHIMERTSA